MLVRVTYVWSEVREVWLCDEDLIEQLVEQVKQPGCERTERFVHLNQN